MDLLELIRLVFRRWYVALPLLLVAMTTTVYTATHMQPEYRASSQVLLVPPALSADTDHLGVTRINPWLGPGLRNVAKSLVVSLQQGGAAIIIAGKNLSPSFTVTVDPYLPIISLAAVGRTEEQAVGTVTELTELVKQSVYQLQVRYKVPTVEYITTQVIDEPSLISTQTNTNKRVIGGFGAAGLLITLAVTIAVDAYLRRGRHKLAAAAGAMAAEVPGAGPGGRPGHPLAPYGAAPDQTAVLAPVGVQGAAPNDDQTQIIPAQRQGAPASGEGTR